jgi:uncharacterized protein (TIGR02284 family)
MENVIEPLLPPDLGASSQSGNSIDGEVQQNSEAYTSEINGDLTDSLNRLIRVLHEGQETYRQASERTKSGWLQGLLRGYSSQREQFVTELSNLAGGLAMMPDVAASVGEVLHQAWLDFKAAVVGVSGDDVDILAECEATEDATKEVYEKELLRGLPPHIQDVVQSQYQEIMNAHDQVRELRDSILP